MKIVERGGVGWGAGVQERIIFSFPLAIFYTLRSLSMEVLSVHTKVYGNVDEETNIVCFVQS